MPTQKIDPIKEFANLRDTVSRAIGQSIQSIAGNVYPLIDIYETAEAVIVRTAPLDGTLGDSLEVAMEEDILTIKGETKTTEEITPDTYLLRERRFGDFSRAIRIPRSVDAENAQAKFTNGILTITLPKVAAPEESTNNATPAE